MAIFLLVLLVSVQGFLRLDDGIANVRSSICNFDSLKSYGAAYKAAHSVGGRGHTFTYNNKLYTTDCNDRGDYRNDLDTRCHLD